MTGASIIVRFLTFGAVRSATLSFSCRGFPAMMDGVFFTSDAKSPLPFPSWSRQLFHYRNKKCNYFNNTHLLPDSLLKGDSPKWAPCDGAYSKILDLTPPTGAPAVPSVLCLPRVAPCEVILFSPLN